MSNKKKSTKINGARSRKSSRKRDVVHSFSSPRATPAAGSTIKCSKPEVELALAISAAPLIPLPFHMEHKFHPTRFWRFDFAWPIHKIAVEVEGGVFMRGRHNRPGGFIGDCEKYNEAALLGWKVIRIPVKGKRGTEGYWIPEAIAMLKRAFRGDA